MIKKIAPDKWKHFFVGIIMGAILQAFLLFLVPAHPFMTVLIAFILVVAISYGFELTSKITGKGHYDILDAVASIAGGFLGLTLIVAFKLDKFYLN